MNYLFKNLKLIIENNQEDWDFTRASDPGTPPEELENIYTSNLKNKKIKSAIASNPSTSGKFLDQISPYHKREVLGNPNAPAGILKYYFKYSPKAALQNPSYDLATLEDPGFMNDLYDKHKNLYLNSVYKFRPDLKDTMDKFVKNQSFQNKHYILQDVENLAHPHALEALKNEEDPDLLSKISRHENASPALLDHLFKNPNNSYQVRSNALDNRNTSGETLRHALNVGGIGNEYLHVAQHKNTPQDILLDMSKKAYGGVIHNYIAMNPNTPKEALIHLSKHPAELVRWSVAGNKNTPNQILMDFQNSNEISEIKDTAKETLQSKLNKIKK